MPTVHFSRRSRRAPTHVPDTDIDRNCCQKSWQLLADAKGYSLYGRDRHDRTLVYLRCCECAELMCVHTHVLRTAQPKCTPCLLIAMQQEAKDAGLEFLALDSEDSHRGIYRLDCGHVVSRQRVFVQQIGRGENGIRCEVCLEHRYRAMAQEAGWELLGPASNGHPGYRRFSHACGHEQDISLGNMKTGRFSCNSCEANWAAAPSAIYLYRLDLPEGASFLKLGMSRNPEARIRYQLALGEDVGAEVLELVAMQSGGEALRAEKRIHKILRTELPHAVVSSDELTWISVVSEVYHLEALPRIRELLADLRMQAPSQD